MPVGEGEETGGDVGAYGLDVEEIPSADEPGDAKGASEEEPTQKDEEKGEQTDPALNEDHTLYSDDHVVSIKGKLPENGAVSAVKMGESLRGAKGIKGVQNVRGAKGADAAGETEPAEVELARYDITIEADGKIWQPEKGESVQVTIEDEAFGNGKALTVYYVNEDGEYLEPQTVVSKENKVTFQAEHFSIYAIVDGEPKIVTVNFYDGNGDLITSEYIKKVENEIQNLYSPDVELETGEGFYGWATEQGAAAGVSDIDILNTNFKAGWDGKRHAFFNQP